MAITYMVANKNDVARAVDVCMDANGYLTLHYGVDENGQGSLIADVHVYDPEAEDFGCEGHHNVFRGVFARGAKSAPLEVFNLEFDVVFPLLRCKESDTFTVWKYGKTLYTRVNGKRVAIGHDMG